MPRLLAGALTIALAAPSVDRALAQGYGPFLEVSKTEAGFTVEAEQATLPQVLTALGQKAGFSVRDTGAERPPIAVFQVRDATLEATLRQLLGETNHLIVYRGGDRGEIAEGTIEKVVLLSPGERERVADSQVSSLAGPGAVAPTPRPAGRSPEMAQDLPAVAPGDPGDAQAAVDPEAWDAREQEQLEYGEALEELEAQAIEQLGVDPSEVMTAEPGIEPPLPPNVLQRLEEAARGAEGEIMPPGGAVAPVQ